MWSITNPQTDTCREDYQEQLFGQQEMNHMNPRFCSLSAERLWSQSLSGKSKIYKELNSAP